MTSLKSGKAPPPGRVTLVGAGPGDPELLTLKAVRCLREADVVMYDRLVSDEVLAYCATAARRILVGKTGGGASCRQDDINTIMVLLARAGNRVVRLKGGDPMVFGRAAEEIAACAAAGIACDVVPGITAALGAAAALKIPLTTREVAHRVQFVTGHTRQGMAPDHDWHALSDPNATTIIYMGRLTLAAMVENMLAAGAAPDLPAAAVFDATRRSQRVVTARLADLPGDRTLCAASPGTPCILLVGRAVAALLASIAPTTIADANACAGTTAPQP